NVGNIQLEIGEEPGSGADYHDTGDDPVAWRDAQQTVPQECHGLHRPAIADRHHDEAADDEKDIDAGGTNGKVQTGALGRVEDDNGKGCESPKILNSVKRLHSVAILNPPFP